MHIYEYSIPSPSHSTRTDDGLLINLGTPAASRCPSSTSTPRPLAPCPKISTSIPRSRNTTSTMSSPSRRSVRTGSSSGHTPYVPRRNLATAPNRLHSSAPGRESILLLRVSERAGGLLAYAESALWATRVSSAETAASSHRSTPSCCGRGSRPTPRSSGGWARLHGRACRTCWNGQRRSAVRHR